MPSARSGQYRLQPGGYRAFVPKPLPPEPALSLDPDLLRLLADAERALGRLDGATDTLPHRDLFVVLYVRKEAVLSSEIEGTRASLIDVVEFEAGITSEDRPSDVAEVFNYVQALNTGLDLLSQLPVSLRLIRSIHATLMEGSRGGQRQPGEFRRIQNWIGPPGSTLKDADFVPPPPQELDGLLGELERYLHQDSELPLLLKIALAHAQFETIHPFLDGNGRIGRLLVTLLMVDGGILRQPLLYLSNFLRRNRSDYYARLQAIRDSGDWEGWLKFFLRGVAEVATDSAATARSLLALREDHRRLLSDSLGTRAGKGLQLQERLFRAPVISIQQAAQAAGISTANATRLVQDFVRLGLLEEITGQRRHRRYRYAPYLQLFT